MVVKDKFVRRLWLLIVDNLILRYDMGQDKTGHCPCPNVLLKANRMNTETRSNFESPEPRGWEALEIKLKAKGLSAGEISQARKSFFDGIETLAKMFLSTNSVEELKKQEAQEGFE